MDISILPLLLVGLGILVGDTAVWSKSASGTLS
jgi:hypothetical protein